MKGADKIVKPDKFDVLWFIEQVTLKRQQNRLYEGIKNDTTDSEKRGNKQYIRPDFILLPVC
jgi:hypothetical protein